MAGGTNQTAPEPKALSPEDAKDGPGAELAVASETPAKPAKSILGTGDAEVEDWVTNVDEVSQQIKDILDGTITDFEEFDRQQDLKKRATEIRSEELEEKKKRYFLYGLEGKGEGTRYKWWCKRCFVEYSVDLPENQCTRCKKTDKMMTQQQRRDELMGKLDDFKEVKVKHQFRKDKWLRWKKSQAILKRSRSINYKAWEYWEPDTDSDEEGDPIVPRDNPEFLAMEADMKQKQKKTHDRSTTAHKCRERGNLCMKEGDFVGAIEHYEEGLEYRRDIKAIWTNKALAEIKIFRWHDAIASCNKVIEYSEIFEDGFTKSADACFKAFTRRATALRALHKWDEALEDLEDACKLFPKDKESRNLFDKTKLAVEEAEKIKVEKLHEGGTEKTESSPPETKNAEETPIPAEAPVAAAPPTRLGTDGPVRVEIEESDEEEENLPVVSADSLAGMTKQNFAKLVQRLKKSPNERTLFCARSGGDSASYAQKDQNERDRSGRKVVLKIEEVPDASGLDNLLKDCERSSILWKKHQGYVVPLRTDVGHLEDPDEAKEKAEAWAFLQVTVPRVLDVLYLLASKSELHCELSATAVRHVWPFLSSDTWRHQVLELLMEWSQCPVSARGLAEFASRYPKPHLQLLIDAVTKEEKANMLPPNFEESTRAASERLDKGELGIDAALDDVLRGLSSLSAAELAVSTLGNICVAGHVLPAFKEQITPFCDEIATALCRQLKPLDWRLCGRAAGTVANIMRLGPVFVDAVQEKCLEPLVTSLREESKNGGPMSMMAGIGAGMGGGAGKLPFVKATSRVLGALVNFLVIRPSGIKLVRDLGVLQIIVPMMEVTEQSAANANDDEDPAVIATRALTLAGRLVREAPESMSMKLEADILCRVDRLLEQECRAVSSSDSSQSESKYDTLDLALRILTALLTKREGALDRLTSKAPRCQELPEGVDLADLKAAVPFDKLMSRLVKLMGTLKADAHMRPDDEGTASSRIRGNLALLFAKLVEAQGESDAGSDLKELKLESTVAIFIDWLRKERGPVQQNIGVCLTKMASSPQYKQQVRDLKGIESLHQIMLPKVQAQKEVAMKLHRLKGPQTGSD